MSSLVLTSVLLLSSVGEVPAGSDPFQWQRSKSAVALVRGDHIIWQYNYGHEVNVPYFHPVSTVEGQTLTCNEPPDHAWHHGIWFCWKYINNVNYWEHVGRTGAPEGRTEWSDVDVKTKDDGSAVISMSLRYRRADEAPVVLSETRQVSISAPDAEGIYSIDWTSAFVAGESEVTLDRTPPKEKSWGGYAGLSIRFAKEFTDRQTHDTRGLVEFQDGNRHRERAVAMDYSGLVNDEPVGVAFLDHPDNTRHPTRWYAIRDPVMSYINAALLNDEPLKLQPKQEMTLRYRMIIHPNRWTPDRLQVAFDQFKTTQEPTE